MVRDVRLDAAVVGRVGEPDDAVVGVGDPADTVVVVVDPADAVVVVVDPADAVVVVVDPPDAVVATVSSTPDRTVVVMVDVAVVSPPDAGVTVSGARIVATIAGMLSVVRGCGVAAKRRLRFGGGSGCVSAISPEVWDRRVFFAANLREAEAVCLPIFHDCTCYCMRMC